MSFLNVILLLASFILPSVLLFCHLSNKVGRDKTKPKVLFSQNKVEILREKTELLLRSHSQDEIDIMILNGEWPVCNQAQPEVRETRFDDFIVLRKVNFSCFESSCYLKRFRKKTPDDNSDFIQSLGLVCGFISQAVIGFDLGTLFGLIKRSPRVEFNIGCLKVKIKVQRDGLRINLTLRNCHDSFVVKTLNAEGLKALFCCLSFWEENPDVGVMGGELELNFGNAIGHCLTVREIVKFLSEGYLPVHYSVENKNVPIYILDRMGFPSFICEEMDSIFESTGYTDAILGVSCYYYRKMVDFENSKKSFKSATPSVPKEEVEDGSSLDTGEGESSELTWYKDFKGSVFFLSGICKFLISGEAFSPKLNNWQRKRFAQDLYFLRSYLHESVPYTNRSCRGKCENKIPVTVATSRLLYGVEKGVKVNKANMVAEIGKGGSLFSSKRTRGGNVNQAGAKKRSVSKPRKSTTSKATLVESSKPGLSMQDKIDFYHAVEDATKRLKKVKDSQRDSKTNFENSTLNLMLRKNHIDYDKTMELMIESGMKESECESCLENIKQGCYLRASKCVLRNLVAFTESVKDIASVDLKTGAGFSNEIRVNLLGLEPVLMSALQSQTGGLNEKIVSPVFRLPQERTVKDFPEPKYKMALIRSPEDVSKFNRRIKERFSKSINEWTGASESNLANLTKGPKTLLGKYKSGSLGLPLQNNISQDLGFASKKLEAKLQGIAKMDRETNEKVNRKSKSKSRATGGGDGTSCTEKGGMDESVGKGFLDFYCIDQQSKIKKALENHVKKIGDIVAHEVKIKLENKFQCLEDLIEEEAQAVGIDDKEIESIKSALFKEPVVIRVNRKNRKSTKTYKSIESRKRIKRIQTLGLGVDSCESAFSKEFKERINSVKDELLIKKSKIKTLCNEINLNIQETLGQIRDSQVKQSEEFICEINRILYFGGLTKERKLRKMEFKDIEEFRAFFTNSEECKKFPNFEI